MRRFSTSFWPASGVPLRALGLAALAAALLGPAAARGADAAADSEAARWRGAYCTPAGCSGPPASPWGMAAGFGAAVLTVGWLARRS